MELKDAKMLCRAEGSPDGHVIHYQQRHIDLLKLVLALIAICHL